MFTEWLIMENDIRLLEKKICFHSVYSQGKLSGIFLFAVLDYMKAVILGDFHKTIKER